VDATLAGAQLKRGSFVGRRSRLRSVSAKVQRQRPEFDAVYALVNFRSGGRCEAIFPLSRPGDVMRCVARATDHHHTRRPRRSFHTPAFVIHLCRRHHDMCSASYRVGRLRITPMGEGHFMCEVVTKEHKWA